MKTIRIPAGSLTAILLVASLTQMVHAGNHYWDTNSTTSGFGAVGGITWTAAPEPNTALAGLLLGFGLLRRHRKYRVGTSGPTIYESPKTNDQQLITDN